MLEELKYKFDGVDPVRSRDTLRALAASFGVDDGSVEKDDSEDLEDKSEEDEEEDDEDDESSDDTEETV